MKTSFLALLLLLSASWVFAGEVVDYDKLVAFAIDRTASEIPKEKAIFCLGPDQIDEFYLRDGKEEKRVARYAHVYAADDIKSVGGLLRIAREKVTNATGTSTRYELCVYRKPSKQMVVRIVGMGNELDYSQFRLKGGDLIVIQLAKAADQ